jgi:peptide/nickel transport system permease protein
MRTLRAEAAADRGGWILEPPVPFGPNEIALEDALRPPDSAHLLGTDELGRDVLARLVHGARASLAVGLVAVLLYVALGVVVGACAGYYGGRVDAALSRATEVMLSFPTVFLVLCVLGVTRARGLLPIILVIGLTRWTDVSRLVRAEVLRLRELDFVHASRALGARGPWVVARHLVPNATGPVLVAATFGVAGAILLETALSFLGFGIQPPASSWGELLTQAHRYITYPGAWWLTVFPGLAIFLTVASFNLVGEALRDASGSGDV